MSENVRLGKEPITVEFDPDTVDVCPAHARFVRAKEAK